PRRSYRTVTVVERDALSTDPAPRRGVPQGRLIHALLARGAQVLDELFPGFLDQLVASGAIRWDGDYAKLCFSVAGHQLVRSGWSPSPNRCRSTSRADHSWNATCFGGCGTCRT